MFASDQWVIEGGRLLPESYIEMSETINRKYYNIEIGMLRAEDHLNENSKDHPFCLFIVNGDNVQPIKYLKEEEMNIGYLLWWLEKNGTTDKSADDHFKEMLDDIQKQAIAQKKIRAEQTAEETDLLATIASSPLHTFRHNGNKIGADNNVPTLKKKETEWL